MTHLFCPKSGLWILGKKKQQNKTSRQAKTKHLDMTTSRETTTRVAGAMERARTSHFAMVMGLSGVQLGE